MSEQEIAPVLNVTKDVMTNHLITFLIQYIASIQHITDKEQLLYEILHVWEKKFVEAIDIVKLATAQTYAETTDESEDVWTIILDASNAHLEDMPKEFSKYLRKMILKNLNMV